MKYMNALNTITNFMYMPLEDSGQATPRNRVL